MGLQSSMLCVLASCALTRHENGSKSGYTVIGAKPTAKQHTARPRAVDDNAFLLTIQKNDRQPWRPWTKGSEPADKMQRTQESSSPAAPSTPGAVYPPPAYTCPRAPAAYPYYYASYEPAPAAYPIPPPPPRPAACSLSSTYPPPPIGPPRTNPGNGQYNPLPSHPLIY